MSAGIDKGGRSADSDRTEAVQDETRRLGNKGELGDLPANISASLVIRTGPKKGAEYSIPSSRTVLGRGTGSDIIIDDPAVSRMHSAIEYAKKAFVLSDLESMNGTLVDGKSIKQSVLANGDTFQIGDIVIAFVLAERRGGSVYVIE
ncbi:MAG: hypothetical protein A2X57_00260 [Nitrospirae bacterium GWD2_57_8]|nr:MAG: hypothetical protein A2X57_00260 [Nitrospirae bacterium GWD2_57_8]